MSGTELTLNQLCDRAGVSVRTVRYYIQQGLLPPAERTGPGATYSTSHLDRIQLIRQLKVVAEAHECIVSADAADESVLDRDFVFSDVEDSGDEKTDR